MYAPLFFQNTELVTRAFVPLRTLNAEPEFAVLNPNVQLTTSTSQLAPMLRPAPTEGLPVTWFPANRQLNTRPCAPPANDNPAVREPTMLPRKAVLEMTSPLNVPLRPSADVVTAA